MPLPLLKASAFSDIDVAVTLVFRHDDTAWVSRREHLSNFIEACSGSPADIQSHTQLSPHSGAMRTFRQFVSVEGLDARVELRDTPRSNANGTRAQVRNRPEPSAFSIPAREYDWTSTAKRAVVL